MKRNEGSKSSTSDSTYVAGKANQDKRCVHGDE